MAERNALGEFLRARRGLLHPDDVGVASNGHRRVPGLRREELASLVGVSRDYYTRLEQGRERHPSAQVLTAIARALGLAPEETAHLFRLAQPAAVVAEVVDPETIGRVHPAVLRLLDRLGDVPACVVGPALDVLELTPVFAAFYGVARGDNLVEMTLLDPAARSFFRDWDVIVHGTVATLRASASRFPADPRIAEVVATVSARSAVFADIWAHQRVHARASEDKRYHHPLVGEVDLHFEALSVSSSPGQQLFTYLPEPGTPSEERLARLARVGSPHR